MSIIEKITRNIASYKQSIRDASEETITSWQDYVEMVYIQRYLDHRHGKHEDRPQHWQQYLDR